VRNASGSHSLSDNVIGAVMQLFLFASAQGKAVLHLSSGTGLTEDCNRNKTERSCATTTFHSLLLKRDELLQNLQGGSTQVASVFVQKAFARHTTWVEVFAVFSTETKISWNTNAICNNSSIYTMHRTGSALISSKHGKLSTFDGNEIIVWNQAIFEQY